MPLSLFFNVLIQRQEDIMHDIDWRTPEKLV